MNKRERIDAAIKREDVDRPPIALWRHFPGDDLDATKLARRVVDFQNEFDFDFVKVTPAAAYVAEMYGGALRDAQNREGTRVHVRRVVNEPRDWDKIRALDSSNAVFQRERAAIERIRVELGRGVPILQTIFSPLTAAKNLAGDRLLSDLREHPGELHRALARLGMTTLRFARESIDAGADAIFFATQMASSDIFTLEEYRAFGQPYDLTILNELRGKVDFILLHAHGENIYFDLLAKYPVQILNWHDRLTPPTLAEAKPRFHGALAGGIDEWSLLASGTAEQIQTQVRDAIQQTGGEGLIVASGCVIPIDTPEENIRAAREAVEPK